MVRAVGEREAKQLNAAKRQNKNLVWDESCLQLPAVLHDRPADAL